MLIYNKYLLIFNVLKHIRWKYKRKYNSTEEFYLFLRNLYWGLGEGLFGQVLCKPGQNQDLDCGQAEQIQAVSK